MSENYKKIKVSRNLLHFFAKKGDLEEETLEDAFQEAGIYPDRARTTYFLDRLMLSIGAIFLVCALIFFLAYNWAALHKFIRLGIIAALLLVAGVFTYAKEHNTYSRKIGLSVLCGLTGALFAQFGQIYQTGANAYDFFLAWTAVITAWVVVSRYPVLWLFYLFLINLTLGLYHEQVRSIDEALLMWIFIILNGSAWVIWEYFHHRQNELFSARFFPRIVGGFTIFCITMKVMVDDFQFSYGFYWIIWFGLLIGIYAVYRNAIRDLLFIAGAVMSIMTLYCHFIFEEFRLYDVGGFLLAGCSIVIVTFVTVRYLVNLNKKWKQESLYSEND